MMFGYGAHLMFWQAALMWAGMIVFLGLVIWAVFAMVSAGRKAGSSSGGQYPRRILDERLACGDIDAEEYRWLRDLVGSGDRHA